MHRFALGYRSYRVTRPSCRFLSEDIGWNSWLDKYRLTVNQTFRDLSESKLCQAEAVKRSIDVPNWQNYVNKYRRSFIASPVSLLGSNEAKAQMTRMIEDIHTHSNQIVDANSSDAIVLTQQLEKVQHTVFEQVITKAQTDLSDFIAAYDVLATASDLRVPHEWYPRTRLMKRRIIYHGGPTNSGKVATEFVTMLMHVHH